MSQPLRAMGNLSAAMQEGLGGLIRVYAVIDAPVTIRDAPNAVSLPAGRGRVRFDNVAYVYPDGRPGLRGLTFIAEPGQTIALVGPSGAGKSTALTLIPRLHDPSEGTIQIDGADLRHDRE